MLMKKILLSVLSLLAGYGAYAEQVPADRAMKVASCFSESIQGSAFRSAPALRLVYEAKDELRATAGETRFYVFNRGEADGFVIVSGDDRALPVLGYATSGSFSYGEAPANMKAWLDGYADEIAFATRNIEEATADTRSAWDALLSGSAPANTRAAVMLNTPTWGQGEPFNEMCPLINGQRAKTGCVATAMAEVMRYHQHPANGSGSMTTDGGVSADFNVAFDWSNMLEDYTGAYTAEQASQAAQFSYLCGVSCNMAYGLHESSAQQALIVNALPTFFFYDKGILRGKKDNYTAEEWNSIIANELASGRPVVYGGEGSDGGHTFLLDGSDGEMYHVNWGWNGQDNGYFRLSALTPGDVSYTSNQEMVYNIKPDEGGENAKRVRLCVTGYSSMREGLSIDKQPQPGERFIMRYSSLSCESPSFVGYYAFALCDKENQIKEIISDESRLEFAPNVIWSNGSRPCQTTLPIEEGDRVCMVVKPEGGDWAVVPCAPGLTGYIELTHTGEAVVWYRLWKWSYPSGVTLMDAEGYDHTAIPEGGEYKFYLDNPNDLPLAVTCNGERVLPDENGVYTISDVRSDLEIEIVIDPSVANEEIAAEEVDVYVSDGMLHIVSPTPARAFIVTSSGKMYRELGVVSGDVSVSLPGGFYVVVVGDRSFKIVR